MNLKVFNSNLIANEPIYLTMVEDGYGNVDIIVVDKVGNKKEGGHLFSFRKDGTITCVPRVDPNLGFKLSSDRRVVVSYL